MRKCMWQVHKQSSHDKSSPDKVVPTKSSSNIKWDFKYEFIHPQFCLSTTTAAIETFLFKISYIYYCDPQAGWTTGWLDAEFSVAVSIMKCVVRCWQHCLAVMLAGQKTVNN